MSARRGTDNIISLVRDLADRVRRLETQTNNVRRNDVRIGDLLITWNGTTNQMTLQNLATNGVPVTINVP